MGSRAAQAFPDAMDSFHINNACKNIAISALPVLFCDCFIFEYHSIQALAAIKFR
jgi:hypothetical protein